MAVGVAQLIVLIDVDAEWLSEVGRQTVRAVHRA
jgi:hypothetical protein